MMTKSLIKETEQAVKIAAQHAVVNSQIYANADPRQFDTKTQRRYIQTMVDCHQFETDPVEFHKRISQKSTQHPIYSNLSNYQMQEEKLKQI